MPAFSLVRIAHPRSLVRATVRRGGPQRVSGAFWMMLLPLLLLLLAACGGEQSSRIESVATGAPRTAAAPVVAERDDFGAPIVPASATSAPARIVSLNPSVTETLFAIGAGPRMIGRSRWDLWPAAALQLPALGDGIRPNVEALLAARPDLVVLYASADNRAAALRLAAAGVRTLSIKVDTLGDFRRVTRLLGVVTGDSARAGAVVDSVDATIARVRQSRAGRARVRAYYFLSDQPAYTIGRGSYIGELLLAAGAENVFGDLAAAAPVVALEEIIRRDPDVIVANRAAAVRLRELRAWRSVRAVRERRIAVVDDELTERPGVRMGEAAVHLAAVLDSLAAVRRPARP